MTDTPATTRIREALEAGPTPGEWLHGVRRDGSIWLSIGDRKGSGGHFQGDLVASVADAATICAANPEALRELLTEREELLARLDAAEKDAGRYRRLRAHSFVCTNRDAPSEIHFGIGFKQTRPELLDVAIDAALTHNEGEPHV